MTRRIVLAILLTVWATLLAGGASAYLMTRAVLLADLDASLVARAASLPQLVDEQGVRFKPVGAELRAGEQYIVQDDVTGRTLARSGDAITSDSPPILVHAAFNTLADGSRVRTVTVRAMALPEAGGPPQQILATLRGSAESFDHLLERLAIVLIVSGLAAAALAAAIARSVARRALLPLSATADVVGSIDEASLSRRIDSQRLPAELVPVATRLNEMLARLEESINQRRQFLADASHELRTPVAALRTAMEVALRRDRDAGAYRQAIQTSLTDAQLLQRLVETLLDHVRDSGAEPQHAIETVDLDALVNECVQALKPLADARSIQIDIRAGASGIRLETQPDRLRSVLLNLIGNAIEHNHDNGKVEVSYAASNGKLRIEVSDTGPGIAPQHLAHLFDPFYRAEIARTCGHLGLGLYLVRSHVQALGGTCEVKSQPGEGATFVTTIVMNSRTSEAETGPDRSAGSSADEMTMNRSH